MRFDEKYYLKTYPDVSEAIKEGIFKSGLEHYEKHGKREGRKTFNQAQTINMEDVPSEFCKREKSPYPLTSRIEFEYWFYQRFIQYNPDILWTYLPITWTEIHRFGTSELKSSLQSWLNKLPKDKGYFTICQHDDGIQFKIPDNVLVYASGNYNPKYYPIPLLYETNDLISLNKDVEFSFVGADTHQIRQELIKYYPKNAFITDYKRDLFTNLIGRSQFSLCPRGYGATSFRIMEALMCNSIPIYISDKFIEPFNIPFETYGIKVSLKEIYRIPEIIKATDLKKFENNKDIALKYFTYKGCYNTIIDSLR